MKSRNFSFLDRLCIAADNALQTLAETRKHANRPSPGAVVQEAPLSDDEKRTSARLMRVNHTGEVCAQALYQGQALTAKLPRVREEMEHACEEEVDHLLWCSERLAQLDSRTSYLNPIFYALSFTLGAGAGAISDRLSLGFVAATEDQVVEHLERHLGQLPAKDLPSRAIVDQMRQDEYAHKEMALQAGGMEFSDTVKTVMTGVSRLMTESVSRV
jgi:ubiquinone biosynthesis monooxygenase Coq7